MSWSKGSLAVVAALTLGAGLAWGQAPANDIFLGTKLGMSKADFGRLPAMKAKPPRCLRFDLRGPPPARDLQSCDLPADEGTIARRYLFAPDPSGVTRLISVSMIGHRDAGPAAFEVLQARWGKPSGTTELKDANGKIYVWSMGAQQMLLRYPCGGRDDLCLEYSDRPFARQAMRAAQGLLGAPGDRY